MSDTANLALGGSYLAESCVSCCLASRLCPQRVRRVHPDTRRLQSRSSSKLNFELGVVVLL